jgi:hypothetical protein
VPVLPSSASARASTHRAPPAGCCSASSGALPSVSANAFGSASTRDSSAARRQDRSSDDGGSGYPQRTSVRLRASASARRRGCSGCPRHGCIWGAGTRRSRVAGQRCEYRGVNGQWIVADANGAPMLRRSTE